MNYTQSSVLSGDSSFSDSIFFSWLESALFPNDKRLFTEVKRQADKIVESNPTEKHSFLIVKVFRCHNLHFYAAIKSLDYVAMSIYLQIIQPFYLVRFPCSRVLQEEKPHKESLSPLLKQFLRNDQKKYPGKADADTVYGW